MDAMSIISTLDCVIISVSAVTSILVITAFIFDKELHYLPSNKFLISYVVTNFLVSSAGIPLSLFSSYSDYEKRPEKFLLSSSYFVFAVVAYMVSLSVITLDRYLAIMYPLEYSVRMTRKKANKVVFGFGLGIALFGIVTILIATFAHAEKENVSTAMITVMHISAFTGFMSLIFVNSIVMREVRRQTRILHSLTIEESGESRRILKNRETRTAYLCFAMIFTFICSWLPNAILAVIRLIRGKNLKEELFLRIGTTVFFTGLTINLFLYIFWKTDFRSSLKARLSKLCCWKVRGNRISSAFSTSDTGLHRRGIVSK
ncbi:G-protein coupled receptor 161-like [Rhopilema esculentum]|uniref:G-protein coupled receptor 161-like n=1 Tax=Rhopilema esculentum TaxID=499914 RepID=UPI0031E30B07|eukprot:gene14285-5318_t